MQSVAGEKTFEELLTLTPKEFRRDMTSAIDKGDMEPVKHMFTAAAGLSPAEDLQKQYAEKLATSIDQLCCATREQPATNQSGKNNIGILPLPEIGATPRQPARQAERVR